MKFLNQTKEKYDWENDEIKDGEGLLEENSANLYLPADIPGVDLEDGYTNPGPAIKEEEVDNTIRATATCVNNSLSLTIGVSST